jgi:hypothetical protein
MLNQKIRIPYTDLKQGFKREPFIIIYAKKGGREKNHGLNKNQKYTVPSGLLVTKAGQKGKPAILPQTRSPTRGNSSRSPVPLGVTGAARGTGTAIGETTEGAGVRAGA